MRFCSTCGDFYADQLLLFCVADGTPLLDVDPGTETWQEGVRVVDRKATAERAQNRKLKWKRATLRTMLMATLVVTVAAFSSSISVTVDRPRGELCITSFNDLNGDGVRDAGEPDLPGFVFQVSGASTATTLTTGANNGCEDLPPGTYTVVEQPRGEWKATTLTTQMVTIAAGQPASVFFGSQKKPEQTGILCAVTFDDQNGNGVKDSGEAVLSGFVFQITRTDAGSMFEKDIEGGVCPELPVGKYAVVQTPKHGWITPAPQTVTISAGKTYHLAFGSRQETGKLCISAFDDKNADGVKGDGEAVLSGFVFQVSGTDPGSTFRKDIDSGFCSGLPVGGYRVVETPKPGWAPTTKAPQTFQITKEGLLLFFGKHATDSPCSDADKDRERANILSQCRKIWSTPTTAGQAVPTKKGSAPVRNGPVARDDFDFSVKFNGCSNATVTYRPMGPGGASAAGHTCECLKTGNEWKCHRSISARASVTFGAQTAH